MRYTPILILALAAAMSQSASAQAPDGKPVYRMKAEEAHVGTNIKRDAAVFRLPYDKPYAQLSAEDKAIVRGVYERMGPDDEPPFPLRGYKTIFKALSTVQGKLQAQGELDIAVIVDPQGNGTGVKVYKSPDPEMTKVVATLMMLEKYKPALCSGQPCEQEFPLRVSFTLEH
ncbi:energy transducer TonB [Pseudoduganella sp. LjRoot289]|uniref:energy transducer TonB n=1 Tax=Pseudoduganella sp. LjRoot289 TaxID=3342314 RepID=UPI003ECD01EC